MLAAILALTASVSYGTSDFVASYAARHVTPLAIAWWAHVLGAAALGGLALAVAGLPEVSLDRYAYARRPCGSPMTTSTRRAPPGC
jgi:hypothetical protein